MITLADKALFDSVPVTAFLNSIDREINKNAKAAPTTATSNEAIPATNKR